MIVARAHAPARGGCVVVLALLALVAASCRGSERRASPPPPAAGSGVAPVLFAPRAAATAASPWASPEQCAQALANGARAPREPGRVRIGTWNVRWFPDGRPGKKPAPHGIDVAWLACAIAWLDVDALAVQEFKTHAAARERTAELLSRLDAATGGRWTAQLDPCPNAAGQHVGLLFDARRVTATGWQTYASLNPHGEACRDQLRPGFGAYLRFQSGLDLHVVSVHLKSGQKHRDYALRRRSFAGLGAALRQAQLSVADEDVLFAGDFNSMGCERCSPAITSEAELTDIDRELAAGSPPLRRLVGNPGCSHYFGRRATLLDFFVAASLSELATTRSATVYGPCAALSCQPRERERGPSAFAARLSDHCPVVIDLDAADKD